MNLIDANLLIYAHVREMPDHEAARDWLDRQLNEQARVGLPWPSLLAFVRLVSNPRVFDRALPLSKAWRQVEEWLSAPASWIPAPTDRHVAILGRLLGAETRLSPNLVTDAHLAALAIEHGLTLCSADRGFAGFSELDWKNPLVASFPQ